MKGTDSGSCCRCRCDFGCCCRASRRAHYTPYRSGDATRTPQSPRQTPSRERRRPEPAGSWAAAAEEEEAAAAATPWMRDYFAEDDGEMVPRTSHTAAFLSDTKDRGPPVQSQIWRSGEKVPFVQTYSLRAFEKPPQVQTQALRDFEKHLNDLKKENFSLKLRIYFLEERMQQKYEASREDIYKRNIELKVEVESLKRELQDKKQHLDKTWADVENLNSQNEAELRRQFEERQQETEHVYELLENKIQLLQEESRLAKSEAARMAALVEAEKECNLELSEKLKGVTKNWEDVPGDQVKPDQYTEALAQRDKRIEELNQSLAAQEMLVEQLSREKQQLLHLLEEPTSMEVQPMTEELLKQQKLNSHETTITQQSVSDSHLAELQEKIQQTEATNKILQEKLNEMSYELKCAQESSQKQDGTIQNLKETLKSRERETEELYQVIEGQNDTMAKLREMLHQSQLGQLHSSEGTSPAQQQVALLDLQSALFCSQLEIQKLQRVVRQKERQLADAKQCVQFVEAAAHESEQQKEASWKHNQELRKALQQLQEELQNKSQQLRAWEAEKYNEIRTQEQNIQHLNHSLSHKEQLLQEFRELLQYRDNSDKTLEANEMLLEKLHQRIHDKAVALERAIDEKFSALEEKEKELRQLRLAVRERDHDLERLRGVLSSNEATMQSMESLLRAKGLEVEQLSTTCQNLQWLKEEMETKFSRWQKEQESIIQQLQTSLHDRNKEVEDLSATLLCKLGPGQSEIAEELCQRLQRKERMLQDLLSDRNKQVLEHEMEIQGLLQSVSTREQESQAAAEKLVQALMERNSELQALRQYLGGRDSLMSQAPISNQQAEVTPTGRLGKQTDQGSMQIPSRDDSTSLTAKEDVSIPRSTLGDLDTVAGLEKELSNAKEELELMAKKERESQMELSALQSMMAVQEEELQVQAADMESLTRNIQIKEDLIKDLQMQLVDPEDIPAMERLTQEVLLLREKVASVESQGQEISGNRRQQLLLMLEGLVDERSRLNEALQAERQLYSSLVKFHAHPESSERDRTLQVELEGAQVLRSRLEEVLGRSLERLNRLETLAAIGGATAGDDTEDTSTEFTDSIEEEAAHHSHQQLVKVALEKSLATVETQNPSFSPPSPMGGDSNRCLQEEMLHLRAEIHQRLEEKRKAEEELKELKAQIEEAGFSSVSHIRNTMLSLCLENAELKEQMGEAMSDGWEIEEDKEKGEVMVETVVTKEGLSESSLQAEFRKLQGKLKNAHNIINLLKEQLVLSSKEGNSKLTPELLVHLTSTIERINTELVGSPGKHQHQEEGNVTVRPFPRPQSLDLGATFTVDAHQLDNQSQPRDPGPQSTFSLPGSTQHLRSQLSQCKQRYQDLQEKLLLSEATVFAQANELEKYRVMLSESLVKQDSKQIQVDLQDLGYETCGRSENEAEREETTSPECEEHNSLKEMVLMEGLCSEQGRRGSTLASSSERKPLENQLGKQEEFRVYGKSENILVLRKDIKDLKAQLQNANKVIQNLKSRVRSLSVTSDYSSSLERPRKLRAVGTLEGSSPHSVPDEDEGWLSDGTGAFYSPGLQAKKDLESLIQRVSQLEAQLPKNGLEEKLAEELRSASWPGKYDSLIQDQARELSYLRQKIREGRGICYLITQHAKDTVKSFEDLLRSNDIDYYLGQSFREQLAQGSQLTDRLTSKLSTKDHKSEKDQAGLEPLALRLSRELQEKEKVIEVLQAKLDARSLTPSSSHALSDSHRSPSSTSFLSDELEACSDMDIVSEYTHYEEKKASPSHSDSIHHSSPSAVLSSKPSSTSASQGAKAESNSNPISLPTPQNTPKEANQAHSGASTVPPASTATLLSNDLEADPSYYLNSAQPHSPPRGTIELGRILEPGYLGSSGKWDVIRPQKGSVSGDLSSGSSVYQLNSKPTGADLLEEHLGEIRNLRQRLEESICINDRLREQLEHRLSSTARGRGSTSNFYSQGLESIPQLCSENRVLREENRRLQAQLSHVSREHSQETESLREALLSSRSHLQELEKELEHQKVERQQLLEDLREKQQEVLHFREERLSLQENDSRLQHKLVLLQQQCEEKQQLFESLQSELQIYEALYGNSKKGLKAYSLDACHQIPLSSDLSHLVAEVRALRGQLEQSIQGNNCLRLQLQQQLESGAGKASLSPSSINQNFPASADPGNKQLLLQDSAVSPPVRDVGMNSPALVFPSSASSTPGSETPIINRANGLGLDTSPVMKTPPKLEGDATDGSFANKHGRHVIGHIDDYSALRQQIVEGKLLVKKIVSLVRSACSFPGLEAQGTEVLGSKGIHELRSSTSALHHALEESASLLTMFWRAALPSTHIPVLPGKVGESTERELLELRTKVSKQERLLQSTTEHLKTANQQKESMEQFIVSQLTRTHDVLKKARTNLESSTYRIASVKPYSCPRKGEIPKGSAVYSSLVTLAFQEPCKKRSHQKSLKQQERWACPPFVQLPIC
ncbi:myomegalin isoform X14 [Pan troglodytes]|uniref:myomegalin isoform X14 n=1 Tax=Pan troglodytes TaxID=9598 RepID=UPI0023F0E41E|nr:myomegalin isoform X14 [Pan troglodytes]